MSEWTRTLLGTAALFVYSCLIGFKAIDLAKLEKGGNEETRSSEEQVKKERKALRFDMFRLAADCVLLTTFCLSDLWTAWFGLFHETALGLCTGCFILISATLLLSVFIDWIPVYRDCRQEGRKVPSFAGYLLKQFVNLIKIEFALCLAWIVFLLLEPTKTSLLVRIAGAAGVLLLLRIVLDLAKKTRNKKEKTD